MWAAIKREFNLIFDDHPQPGRYRLPVFVLQLEYLAILAVIFWQAITDAKPQVLAQLPETVLSVPLGVLWFGAVGGVAISLHGIHKNRLRWDPTYWSWHAVRPFVGALVAFVAVLVIQSGALAAGIDPASATNPATANTIYYVIAFVVGYREATFRTMVSRLADVILTSETKEPAPVIDDVTPTSGTVGQPVMLHGSGFRDLEAVVFGTETATDVKVLSDSAVEATAPAGTSGATVPIYVQVDGQTATKAGAYTFT